MLQQARHGQEMVVLDRVLDGLWPRFIAGAFNNFNDRAALQFTTDDVVIVRLFYELTFLTIFFFICFNNMKVTKICVKCCGSLRGCILRWWISCF